MQKIQSFYLVKNLVKRSRIMEDLIWLKSKDTTFEKVSRKYEKLIWLKSKPITLEK